MLIWAIIVTILGVAILAKIQQGYRVKKSLLSKEEGQIWD